MSPAYLEQILNLRPEGVDVPEVFVETGTFHGGTASVAASFFPTVHTIEICPKLYNAAMHRFSLLSAVVCHLGDSARVLPDLARIVQQPAVFYLDAHWFWREAKEHQIPDSSPFPLWAELAAIRERPFADWVLVDDVQCFGKGPDDWPWPIDPKWKTVCEETILGALGRDRVVKSAVHGDCFCIWRSAVSDQRSESLAPSP
jgi:hypothetical protein